MKKEICYWCVVYWRQTPLPLSGGAGTYPACPPCPCPLSRASLGGPVLTTLTTIPTIPPISPTKPRFLHFFYLQKDSYKLGCSGWAALVISSSTIVYRIFGGFVSNIHRNKVQKIKLCWQGHKGSGHGQKGNIRMLQYTSIFQNTLKIPAEKSKDILGSGSKGRSHGRVVSI